MRVLLADQHPDIRLALAILLGKEPGINVVGSASETEGLLALVQSTQPDILILDSRLPGTPIADLLIALHHRNPNLKILLLGDLPVPITQSSQSYVTAVISKNDPPEILLKKFRRLTARGEP